MHIIIKVMLASIAGTILLTGSFLSHAGMYKWTDENGVTHYSQFPPKNIKAESLTAAPGPADDPDQLIEERKKKLEAFDKRREVRLKQQEQEKQTKLEENKRVERCNQIQKNIDTLKYRNRVYENKDGQVVTLTQEDRQEKLAKFQQDFSENCK